MCNGALKAEIAIPYCTHKNCYFGNAAPCSSVTKIAVSQQIYRLSTPNLLQWFIRHCIFIIHSKLKKFFCQLIICLIFAYTVTYRSILLMELLMHMESEHLISVSLSVSCLGLMVCTLQNQVFPCCMLLLRCCVFVLCFSVYTIMPF